MKEEEEILEDEDRQKRMTYKGGCQNTTARDKIARAKPRQANAKIEALTMQEEKRNWIYLQRLHSKPSHIIRTYFTNFERFRVIFANFCIFIEFLDSHVTNKVSNVERPWCCTLFCAIF